MNAPWLGREYSLPHAREIYKDGYTDHVSVLRPYEYLAYEREELADTTIDEKLKRYPDARADYDELHEWLDKPHKVSWVVVQVFEWESGYN